MNTIPFNVAGTLQPDGVTLRLEQKLALPPGPVTITVHPATPRTGPTMLETLDRIHAEQKKRNRTPMSDAEMAAEVSQMRGDDDQEDARCCPHRRLLAFG